MHPSTHSLRMGAGGAYVTCAYAGGVWGAGAVVAAGFCAAGGSGGSTFSCDLGSLMESTLRGGGCIVEGATGEALMPLGSYMGLLLDACAVELPIWLGDAWAGWWWPIPASARLFCWRLG
eukprot:934525-Pelagomonas_calceolata.AAC.3